MNKRKSALSLAILNLYLVTPYTHWIGLTVQHDNPKYLKTNVPS